MKKQSNIYSYLPFLLGFSLCNNIIYLFNYNHLYINISNFLSLFIFLYIILFDKKSISKVLAKIDASFYLYLLFTFLSIVPAIFYFINDMNLMYSYFNGIPSLILLFIEYFTIIYFSNEKNKILKGISFGGIINVLFSLVSYFFFLKGSYFSLYKLFPNTSFQICGSYSLLNSINDFSNAFKIYLYRAQGLFLETSHYFTFLSGSLLITLFYMKKNISKFIFLIVILYLGLLSISGNYIIIIMTLLLYVLLNLIGCKYKKFSRKKVLVFPIILIIFIFGIFYVFTNADMMDKLNYSLTSLNFNDSDNLNRSRTIIEGVQLIEKYPLGIGYNNTSNVLKENFPMETQSYIFSTLILNELELGLIGNIIYLIFLIRFPLFIIRNGKRKEDIIVGISMIGVSLCQLTNGISYWNIQYIIGIYALGNIIFNDLKNSKMEKGDV